MRIVVALPSHDRVPFNWAFDFAHMMTYSQRNLPAGVELGMMSKVGTYVHQARQHLLEGSMLDECDYTLFLDTDHRIPEDTLMRLLSHQKAMVGINYITRGEPTDYVAIKHTGIEGDGHTMERLRTTAESTGLEEVDALGFGAVLIRADVTNSLPRPRETRWFWYGLTEDGSMIGEDVWFCNLVRKNGFKIYVDHDLSNDCSHIGDFEYHFRQMAFIEEADDGSDN